MSKTGFIAVMRALKSLMDNGMYEDVKEVINMSLAGIGAYNNKFEKEYEKRKG